MNVSIEAVSSWCYRTSWQVSFLVILLLVTQRLFRKQLSPRWRHNLWFLVVARLLLPAFPQSPVSVFNVLPQNQVIFLEVPVRFTSVEPARVAPAVVALSRSTESLPASEPVVTLEVARPITAAASAVQRPIPWLRIAITAWALGAVIFAARLFYEFWKLKRHLRQAVRITDPSILRLWAESQAEMGTSQALEICETDRVQSPALFGFWKPVLLMPTGLILDFSQQELRYIFLHEAGHLKRMDIAVNWLLTGLQIIHWFNPFVCIAFTRMRADRELACDAVVLERTKTGENNSYAKTIVKLLERFVRPSPVPGLIGILEERNQMRNRIAMVLSFAPGKSFSIAALAIVALLTVTLMTDAQRPGGASGDSSMVEFYQNALVSRPEIKEVIFSQLKIPKGMSPEEIHEIQRLGYDPQKQRDPLYFWGSQSGPNFNFFTSRSTNFTGDANTNNNILFIHGRHGTNVFKIVDFELTQTTEETRDVQHSELMLSQTAHMGIGSMLEDSVKWRGNTFSGRAHNLGDKTNSWDFYGELEISNNLPHRARLSHELRDTPYLILEYKYPNPAGSLGGYPTKITHLKLVQGKWGPSFIIEILKYEAADHSLPQEHFSSDKYTNYYRFKPFYRWLESESRNPVIPLGQRTNSPVERFAGLTKEQAERAELISPESVKLKAITEILEKAKLLLGAGEPSMAKLKYNQAASLDPKNETALHALASYGELHRPREAFVEENPSNKAAKSYKVKNMESIRSKWMSETIASSEKEDGLAMRAYLMRRHHIEVRSLHFKEETGQIFATGTEVDVQKLQSVIEELDRKEATNADQLAKEAWIKDRLQFGKQLYQTGQPATAKEVFLDRKSVV